MPTTFVQPSPSLGVQKQINRKSNILQAVLTVDLVSGLLLAFMAVLLLALAGCGAGGYAGGDIEALSASAITLDAGQSYKFTTMADGTPTITYSLSGTTCTSGSACGSMSNTTGPTVVYTAPTGITAQIVVILKAAVSGTSSASSVTITVNPDPTLAGTPPGGTVGVPYTTTLSPSGGTAPLTLNISAGSLPPGLTFNATTGAITGTPTTVGPYSFTAQLTDSSAVPYLLTTQETIVIAAPGASSLTISGNPPAGTVGAAYSTLFAASGGSGPYTFSLLSGVLPAGLTLSSAGVLSGTPNAPGVSVFTLQAQDNTGDKSTAVFSITITSASLSLTLSTLPNGTVNVPYSSTIGVAGGTAPYSCVITNGTLPAGLRLTGCLVSGTPTLAGTANLTVMATDSSSPQETTTGPVSLTINPAGSLTLTSPPSGTANTPYTGTIGVSGGTSPYTCSITAGTLPAGLSISNCTITGTPTTPGTTSITVRGTDSSNPALTTTGPVIIVINPSALSLTLSSLPNGTINVPYSSTIGVSGGTAPYACTITSGTLPAGLSLSGCLVSGTPTVAETVNLMVKATDASNPQETTTGPVSLTINPAALTLTLSSLPSGTVNVPYSSTIGVRGGTSPYACTITAGTLPMGLSLTGCVVSGTPTIAETVSLTVKATDASNPQETTTGPVGLTINPAGSLTLTSPPAGTANTPYTGTIGVSGGTAPYACTITGGALPVGLSISNCTITGTPTTPGTTTITVKGTDSGNPILSTTGPITIVINPGALSLTLSSLPNGTVNVPYSSTIGVSGGTSPYGCTITSGTLPAGLSLSGCLVSGTPTVAGTVNLMVKATDSSSPQETTTGPISLTINPASLSLTLSTLPNGTVNVPYSSTIGVSGGTSPYSCIITNGTLPAGLSLTGCLVSGTPTVAGTVRLTVKANDSSNPQETTTGPVSLTINPAAATLTLTSPPAGTVNTPYTGTIGVSGGTAPYACMITAGTLPSGLSISNCTITGTPTTAGSTTLTVKGTDSSSPATTTTGPVTIVINPLAATLTITSPPLATINTPYTGPIGVTGGTAPYSCTITSGTLPSGLTLTSAGCVITGTPTTVGSSTVTVSATGSGTNPVTGSGPITVTVQAVMPLTFTGALPNAIQNTAYTQTLTAQGGVPPYTYMLTTGTLPAGINLSTNTDSPQGAVFSGTPTVVGLSAFTVTVTDSESTPQSVALPLTLLVQYPTGPNNSYLTGPYAYLFQGYDNAVIGALAYKTATVGSFTANGTGGISAGELDANHQSSTATGNTISSKSFVGTYTIGADDRGTMMIIPINANGTIGTASTYDIAVQAPISPATNSAQGSMVEYDAGTVTAGTEGSGTFLAQTASAFSAGLNGSYAFGVSGDQACSVSCSVNLLLGGPVGTVGEFTANGESADGGSIIGGISDTNVVTTNTTESQLSGTYSTVDQNGRVALVMNADNITNTLYPTDFAVYVVNSNQAFVMSTDVHSAFILLAGSAQLQSSTFLSGSTAIQGSFVGYENSAPDPGLVSVTSQQLTNLTTATIFEGSSTSNGCDIASVTIGGLNSIENSLGSVVGLSTLLGNYEKTGDVDCAVDSTGRGILDYPTPTGLLSPVLALLGLNNPPPPRVFYLSSLNTGYFLETGYAAVGTLVNQTGAPYTGANTFTGNYVIASTPPGSAVSINGTGVIHSNGVPSGSTTGIGTASVTQDSVVQVGDLNLLTLGTATAESYGPIDSTTGVFSLGANLASPTYTVYTISPDSYVLVDPSLTSPSVSVLY